MKARVPLQKKLPQKTLREVESYAKEVVNSYEKECMRRFFKLACLALNQDFGFGTHRLQKFIVTAGEHAGNRDEVFWWHVDKQLIDQLGLPFEREKEG